jgi:WD40 repeat protein
MFRMILALAIPCLAGVALCTGQSPTKQTTPILKDFHGDPLPAGALARLGSLRMRLDGSMVDVAFAPDNRGIVVAGTVLKKVENNTRYMDNVLRLWDLAGGKTLREFEGAEQGCQQLAYSADGKTLACLTQMATLVFWNATTGKRLPMKIVLDGKNTQCFALAPTGNMAAIAARGGQDNAGHIVLWDLTKNRQVTILQGHPWAIDSLSFSGDGKQLTSASISVQLNNQVLPGTVILWDVAKGSKIREISHDSSYVKLSPDGSLAAWAPKQGKKIFVADVRKRREQVAIPGDHHSFLFAPDNKTLVTGAQGGSIIFWDTASGKELRRLEGHVGQASRVLRFSRDGKLLATGSWDGGFWSGPGPVRVWDVKTGKEINPAPVHADRITCVACSPDGSMIASGSGDKTIRLWQAATGKPLHLLAGHEGSITALAFSPDGKTLASAAADKSVRLWHTADGKEKICHVVLNASVQALAFSNDGQDLLAAAGDGSIISWHGEGEGDKGKIINLLDKQASLTNAVFSPDARIVAGRRGDGFLFGENFSLSLWQLPWGKPLGNVQVPAQAEGRSGILCWAAAFSPDGRYLATSESLQTIGLRQILSDHTLRIWEVASNREVLKIVGLPNGAGALAFSADGRYLASGHGENIGFRGGSFDKTTLVWDTAAGKKLAQFDGKAGPVTCVAFSPDRKTLVAGMTSYTLLTWDITPLGKQIDLPKQLTAAELKKAWEDLARLDAHQAYRAVGALTAAAKDAVPFLAQNLRPVPPVDRQRIEKLIADLHSDTFSVRNKASRELESMGEVTEPALRKALSQKGSLEYRRRIENLLHRLNQPYTSTQLRFIRALTVLERAGTSASRDLLTVLAGGAPEGRLTQEARTTLARVQAERK